jgi:hypothetical protein
MLRIFKVYNFIDHENNTSLKLEFSSRPGDLSSKDDFYTITLYDFEKNVKSALVVTETSLSTYEKSLYELISYKGVMSWQRAALANRLALNG